VIGTNGLVGADNMRFLVLFLEFMFCVHYRLHSGCRIGSD